MTDHKNVLDKAEATHDELLAAYEIHNQDRARFHALLGAEAKGSEAIGLLSKYGPMLAKYTGAGGAGAGILTVLGNVFPPLAAVLGLGG